MNGPPNEFQKFDRRSSDVASDLTRFGTELRALGRGEELSRMLHLATTTQLSLDRAQLQPGHFTASAFILSPDKRSLLLILHKKLHLWLQPGGHIESSDSTWQHAVAREVREETGLQELIPIHELIDIDIHQIPENPKEKSHLHFDLRGLYIAQTTEVRAGDDAERARWFELEEVIRSIGGTLAEGVGTDESVARVSRAALLLEP